MDIVVGMAINPANFTKYRYPEMKLNYTRNVNVTIAQINVNQALPCVQLFYTTVRYWLEITSWCHPRCSYYLSYPNNARSVQFLPISSSFHRTFLVFGLSDGEGAQHAIAS